MAERTTEWSASAVGEAIVRAAKVMGYDSLTASYPLVLAIQPEFSLVPPETTPFYLSSQSLNHRQGSTRADPP